MIELQEPYQPVYVYMYFDCVFFCARRIWPVQGWEPAAAAPESAHLSRPEAPTQGDRESQQCHHHRWNRQRQIYTDTTGKTLMFY